jgi:hypothetical protein
VVASFRPAVWYVGFVHGRYLGFQKCLIAWSFTEIYTVLLHVRRHQPQDLNLSETNLYDFNVSQVGDTSFGGGGGCGSGGT